MISEAIEILKTYTDGKDNTDKVEISVMQLNRIIKALEQQSTDAISRQAVLELQYRIDDSATLSARDVVNVEDIEDLPPVTPQPNPNIKALGDDIRICQKSITDKKVLIGFNMAVALCNKHLAESEDKE